MREKMLKKLPRFLLTLLLSVGLTLPLLKALDLFGSLSACIFPCALAALALEAISYDRRTALGGSILLIIVFLFWLAGSHGGALLSDIFRAFTLQLSGVPGALPLVAGNAALLITLLISLLSFFCTRPNLGGMGAMLLVMGALLMLWLADRADLVMYLLPAGIAALTLLLLERHQEVSFPRLLPWIAALVLLSFGLTPSSGIYVPELKDRMDDLRQSVMDRLFFTEPREVFSLSTEGYYPQGVSQLGGPANPTNHNVMQVSTPRTAYLRGVVLNEYDGRSWRNTLGGRRYLWESGSMAAQRALLFDQSLPAEIFSSSLTEPMEVSVRMLSDSSSTLFLPQRVRDLRAGGELVPYFTNSSELFVTRNLQSGDTWSVSAPLFQSGDPGLSTLIAAASDTEDPQWDSVRDTYTSLPSHLEEPVWQLAREITEHLDSPYEKAFALQNYLSRNYRYTLQVDYQPSNLDFVTNFLFNTREGYCTYFASALTVLCRMIGLPARYVEGYLAEPDSSGNALVTGLNAHAWTEVYFRGFGWLTFDATPRQGDGGEGSPSDESTPAPADPLANTPEPTLPPASAEETPQPTEIEIEVETPDPDTEASVPPEEVLPVDEASEGSPFPWWMAAIAALVLFAALIALRWFWTSPERKGRHAADEKDRFDIWLEEILHRLSSRGYTRAAGETLMAFTRRLDAEASLPCPLSALGECASLLHYGKVQALPTDTSLAREAALSLKKNMPRKARLRYAIHRLRP